MDGGFELEKLDQPHQQPVLRHTGMENRSSDPANCGVIGS
jgi:hypothetical protein